MNSYKGFTLIELIVSVVLAATLLSLGIPAFKEIILNNRLAAVVNEFVSALNLTRSEAIKRGMRVTLCKSADKASCVSNGGYEQGWVIFTDQNNNAIIDANEKMIRIFDPISLDGEITFTGNWAVARYISYVATGNTALIGGAFQAGTLTLCASQKARRIVISATGRIRTEEGTCS